MDASDGTSVSEGVCFYPRWKENKYCNPAIAQYRQHPLDYIEGLETAMGKALEAADPEAGDAIVGIGIDTTGSTPGPVDRDGVPLALSEKFKDNPNAMFHLWKDHTAVEEAKEINRELSEGEVDYTQYQGIYSSEWFWAKILHTTRLDPAIRDAAYTWVEHCDWMVGLLVGNTVPEKMYHCSCAAGHKALWHSSFHGLPARNVLAGMDEYLGLVYDRYGNAPQPAGTRVGKITEEWAKRLHVNPEAVIGGCSFDAHAGGVGAGVGRKTMVKVVGTSTVDMLVDYPAVLAGKDLRAYCGQAEDSIVPGYVGIEAGQAVFGDAYAWFKDLLMWPAKKMLEGEADNSEAAKLYERLGDGLLAKLEEEAVKCIGEDTIALDWFSGRRYPNLNETVRSGIAGLTLGTKAPSVYCAIVKGTVFGSKRIFESLIENGIQIDRLICVGGIAKKSKMVMQMLSDALNIPIMICSEEQVCAKGAAIYGSVGAGLFDSVEEAQKNLCEPYVVSYAPDPARHEMYEAMYQKYLKLGEFSEKEF